ncbi:transcriptional regulator with XRE-family HTH domain [Inhella inkyongensis]|uniref:Transcriptional regulator with XRE-family HTH domain n=1 Tax=Inhella inkyongensis TaxID=392593 RepID=A0A840S9L2_9BURK|nr:XRE family transcriptional regulator [Inhella inkyongensis]MBB5205474.1 transcriptional regulator with XRE-family HTH domain [Inhella inkyongensis]
MEMDLAQPPQVGEALAALRAKRQLTLDELSRRAGVSKSMLSQIERNQANPTVAVVWRLAHALGVEISELLEGAKPAQNGIEWVQAHATPSLASPDSLARLRILGPIELAGQYEWYELIIQPGGVLASQPHEPGSREHLSVLSGEMEIEVGEHRQALKLGETARYAADQAHAIRNPGATMAVGLLVVLHP